VLADELNIPELRAICARRRLTQLDVANKLGVPVSTYVSWLRGAAPPPPGLPARIELALGLPSGSLAVAATAGVE